MDKHELEELINRGYSHAKLADHFAVSQSTVRHWLKKHGLRTKNNRFNKRCGKGCSNCGCEDKRNFYKKSRNRLWHLCKDCYKEKYSPKRNERLLTIKRTMVEYKGGKCERYGYNKCLASLDFHHAMGGKDPHWKSMRHRSFDQTVKDELDRCQLVCRNCPGELHWEMNHGTVT